MSYRNCTQSIELFKHPIHSPNIKKHAQNGFYDAGMVQYPAKKGVPMLIHPIPTALAKFLWIKLID